MDRVCTERNGKLVRGGFLAFSAGGWVVFLVGLGKMLHAIKEHPSDDEDLTRSFSTVVKAPLWLFLAASTLLYITHAVQIYKLTDNLGHILHCIVVFFNFFYTSGGILNICIGILYESKGSRQIFIATFPDQVAMEMILIGTAISLAGFWLGLGIGPLFNIRRRRRRGYTELESTLAS